MGGGLGMNIKEKIKLNKVTHSVRASQAVLQYGVGAMVDFPEQTLMTAAPETWDSSVMEIHDERLEKVLKVDYFGMPGSCDEARYQNGVSYARFPEWYFCPKCRNFKPLKQWIDEYNRSPKMKKFREKDPYMIKRLRCPSCFQDLVVARIVVACSHGHIDDFPWVEWVHAKNILGAKKVCSNPTLRFTTSASSSEGLEGLTVSCTNCNCRTTLRGAFDKGAFEVLDKNTGGEYNFSCKGRHPWKNVKESCIEYPHVLQRGSSAVYFPISVSSLVIPPYSSILTGKVQNSVAFSDLRKAITETLKTINSLPGITVTQEMKESVIQEKITEFSKKISMEIGEKEEQIKGILERKWCSENNIDYSTTSIKYRAEEYAALNGEIIIKDKDGEFVREDTNIDDYNIPFVKSISLINKVREVQALVGFSRLEPIDSDNTTAENSKITAVNIKEEDTRWYPGYEVRGEGIFIEFDEDAIDEWRSNNDIVNSRVKLLNDNYKKSYYGSLKEREISAKFLLLHTISHILMKQLSFECGYNIASLKERIYCSEPVEGRNMSGIFIYTASGDSEGTMGGLVRQGRSDVFTNIFKKAIDTAMTCSNDPVCSLSQGQGRDSLNLASCYSCSLIPETSCEEFNVFLDRGVVVGTMENPDIGFYSSYARGKSVKNEDEADIKHSSLETTVHSIITDYGIDLSGSNYDEIWKNLLQFTDDIREQEVLKTLIDNAEAFNNKEKPRSGAAFCVSDLINLDVDLVWIKSKIMYFSKENEEEYLAAKEGDWKCFFAGDEEFTWEVLCNHLKEE